MKLILMKNLKYNFKTVITLRDDESLGTYESDEYVRLSEVVDVDFPPLSNEEVVKAEVSAIEKRITSVRADCEASITALEGRKQELLALTVDK